MGKSYNRNQDKYGKFEKQRRERDERRNKHKQGGKKFDKRASQSDAE